MLSVPSSTEPIVLQRKNCVSLYLQPPSPDGFPGRGGCCRGGSRTALFVMPGLTRHPCCFEFVLSCFRICFGIRYSDFEFEYRVIPTEGCAAAPSGGIHFISHILYLVFLCPPSHFSHFSHLSHFPHLPAGYSRFFSNQANKPSTIAQNAATTTHGETPIVSASPILPKSFQASTLVLQIG